MVERWHQAVLAHLEQDLDGFVGASFVDVETGRILAAHSVRPEFDLDRLGGASAQMVRALADALQQGLAVEEIVVTSSEQTLLAHMVSSRLFAFVACDRDGTNPALIRGFVRHRVDESLPAANDDPVAVAIGG